MLSALEDAVREWIWTGPGSLAGLEQAGAMAPWERIVGASWTVTVEPFGAALAVRLDVAGRRMAWVGPCTPEGARTAALALVLDALEAPRG